ncbi:MAG TPA: hypothetical protein VIJ07_10145 [Dermatophilaceae bacterium]|jgi:hypothetical protein
MTLSWRPDYTAANVSESDKTITDWPILHARLAVIVGQWPTTTISFPANVSPTLDDAERVRRAVGRGLVEFGRAFDQLGGT